ncbi:MAG: helix-turn-helix transcriptional regulator [Caulobacteraceae bacterium]
MLGVTFQQVQKYERGTNRVSASMLVKIARRLDCTVASLVGEEGGVVDDSLAPTLAVPGALELVGAFARIQDVQVRPARPRAADRPGQRRHPRSQRIPDPPGPPARRDRPRAPLGALKRAGAVLGAVSMTLTVRPRP